MGLSDLHIHTRYCHGKGEPEEFVREALARGVSGIGLLGHARCTIPCDYAMSVPEEQQLYRLTTALKERYAGQLSIFRGIELDYFSVPMTMEYDYKIGSVHYLCCGNEIVSVDSSRKELENAIAAHYDGDSRGLVLQYYETVADVLNATGADIVGHFDLITKFNEENPFFDEKDPVIYQAALKAMETLVKQNGIFEINTGAISRRCRTTPYPAAWQLEALREMGGRITLSSDAHRPEHIFFQFSESAALARCCGFTTAWVLTEEGFREVSL